MAWPPLEQQEPPNAGSGLGSRRACVVRLGSMGTGEGGRKRRGIFASGPGPFGCLPGMTAACALPREDLRKSGALSSAAPAAPSPLERVSQPSHHEGAMGMAFYKKYNKQPLGMPHTCSKEQRPRLSPPTPSSSAVLPLPFFLTRLNI